MNEKQQDRKDKFEKELRALLSKHKVELYLTDDGRNYGMQSPVLEFEFDDVMDGDILACEHFDVNLRYLDLGVK